MDDRTGPVHVDVPVQGNGMVTASDDPASGNGSGSDHSQSKLWRALRTKPLAGLLLAVLLAMAGGFLGWNLNSKGTPVYASHTVMVVDQPYGIATAGDEGVLLKLVTLRLKYAGLASTDAMAGPVAAKLGLPITEVLSATSVTAPPDSLLLTVTATWTSPREAELLSSAMAKEISSYVKNENVQYAVPPADQFLIDTVNPTTPATMSTPSHRKSAADALALGLVVLVVSFVVAQLIFNRKLLTA